MPLSVASPTVSYTAERWLVDGHDLLTRRELMREEPVVRLI